MKFIIPVLSSITSALLFGAYVGNATLKLNNSRIGRAYAIGCGVGVQLAKNYETELSEQEMVKCIQGGLTVESILNENLNR